jgi:TetR/AcrR family transcriptional regulator, transcriptional repressor for nem operon
MSKGEQTRKQIIRKAAPIFNQRGFAGAALSDLMNATGLEKGGIYRHFDSKQQLAGEAFDYSWRLALDARFAGTQEISNTVDRLKQIVWNFHDRRANLVPGGCPLLNMAADSDDGNPALRRKVRRAFDSWLGRLRSIVEEGQGRGEIRRDVNPAELSTLIVTTIEGSLMLERLQKNLEPLNIACRHLEQYLETNVRVRESKSQTEKT